MTTILNIYQKLENHGWEMGYQLGKAFEQIGHEVITYGYGHPNFISGATISDIFSNVDLVFHTETNSGKDFYHIGKFDCPTAIWLVDTHCVGIKKHLSYARQYDWSFHSTREYIPYFGARSFWMPNAASKNIHTHMDIPKSIDVGFCGTADLGSHCDRKEYIEFVEKSCKNLGLTFRLDNKVLKDNMVRAINEYKIHFNRSLHIDINARVFETTAIGTILLTDKVPHIERLFEPGKEILVYNSMHDLNNILWSYKNYPDNFINIAKNGHERCLNYHMYKNRAEQIIETIFKQGVEK